jgi:bifunctional DNA-binding transcriptional regulator/antitoxin component of YhaV-PrlF toxin-antitoxin module
MQNIFTVKIGQRGVVTLPQALRESYELAVGKDLTLIDLGGVFVLSPKESRVDALAGRLAGDLKAQGETLENLLSTVRQARVRYDE